MNLHALHVFHIVARLGSVTRASEQLMISQPAVTIQLRNLERDTGLSLFGPKGRGVALTEAGEMLAGQAERLFGLEQEIDASIALYREGKRGKLRLTATSLPAHWLLPQWAAGYKLRTPDVDIVLNSCNRQEAIRQLLTYRADLAFVGGGGAFPEQVERELLLEDEMCFVVPRVHPLANQSVALDTILGEPFLVREEGSSAREKLEGLCRERGLALRIGLTFNGLYEIIRAVAAGYGAMFVSALEVKQAVVEEEVALVHVQDVKLSNPIYQCRRRGEKLSPTADSFRAWVRAHLPA
jgi:DNA-binding transcriptional LysR family regulator